MRNTKKGFTLVELLVVIAILAILATVSVVGYTNYIKNANESLALQELSQVKSSILAEDIVNNNFAIGSDGKVNAEGVAKFNEYLAGLATDLNGNLEYVDGTVVYTLEKDTSVVYVLDLKTGEVEAGTATQTPVTPPAGGEEGGETGGDDNTGDDTQATPVLYTMSDFGDTTIDSTQDLTTSDGVVTFKIYKDAMVYNQSGEIRIYQGKYGVINSTAAITSLEFYGKGKSGDTTVIKVEVSNDGVNYTTAGTVEVSNLTNYSIEFDGGYKYVKITSPSKQLQIKTMTFTFAE